MPQGFASGLAQGIFDYMGESAKRQRAQEEQQQKQTFQTLASLLDDATPESKPVLLQQLGQVMGLKGKVKGFWDAISRPGATDLPDQLHQKVTEVFGNTIGAGTAQAQRERAAVESALDAFETGEGRVNKTFDQAAGLDNKVVLRDPNAERIQQLKTQYGMQKQMGLEKLAEQESLMRERQRINDERDYRNRMSINEQQAMLKGMGEVYKEAAVIAKAARKKFPTDEDMALAAEKVARKYGLQEDLLKSRIGLSDAKTAVAQAEAAGTTGTLSDGTAIPGLKPYQRAQFDKDLQTKGQAVYKDWNSARAESISLGNQLQKVHDQIRSAVEARGQKYDATKGIIYDEQNQPSTLNRMFNKLLSEARELTAKKQEALNKMQGSARTLKDQFGFAYKVNEDGWWVEPSREMGGLAPTGAPRNTATPSTYDATTPQVRQGARTANSNINSFQTVMGTASNPATNFKVDQITNIGGTKVRVVEVHPPDDEYPYGRVVIKPIK